MCSEVKTQKTANRKGRGVKILKWGSIAAVCLILLLFFGIPLFLSSSGGTNFFLNQINSSVDGQVQMDDFSIGWFKGIKLTGLSYADSAGNVSVKVHRVETRPKYTSLLGGKVKLGKTVIDQPRIYLKVPAERDDAEEAKTSSEKSATPLPVFPVHQIDLELINGSVTMELAADMPQTVSFTNIASKVQFDQSAWSGAMDVAMNVNESSSISAKGAVGTDKTGWTIRTGDFDVKVSKLQLADLKPLFALADLQVDMAGELNADAAIKIDDNKVEQIKVDVSIADFSQGAGDQRIIFEKPVTIHTVVSGVGKDVQVKTAKVRSEFCNLDCSGTLESMDYALDADLGQTQRVIEPFTDMAGASVSGMLSARGRVSMTDGLVRLISENSKIQQLKISVPDSEPFIQDQVTLDADILMDMGEKTIDIRTLNLQGSRGETLINVTKGVVKKKVSNAQTQVSGQLEVEYDWQVLSAFASAYLPEGLSVKGKRKSTLHFESEYPTDSPEQMIANLNANGAVGFDSAEYLGMNFSPTELKADIWKGILNLQIPQTMVNEGTLQFAGSIDLTEESRFLRLTEPTLILDKIHLNDTMTKLLLLYTNPLFVDASETSGIASFSCEEWVIPLSTEDRAEMTIRGDFQIDLLRMRAGDFMGQLLTLLQTRDTVTMTVHPTDFVLENNFLSYEDMQVDIDDDPLNFKGRIGLDKTLSMTVQLPWTTDLHSVKSGRSSQDRITVPIEGSLDHPEIDMTKFIEKQGKELIEQEIMKQLDRLFK